MRAGRPWSVIVPDGVSLSNKPGVRSEAEVTTVSFAFLE